MNSCTDRNTQAGFSIYELVVAITVFLIVTAAAFALMGNAVRLSTTQFDLADSQETLRFAQEYINRDLIDAGANMPTVRGIRLPTGFVTSYLTADQVAPAGGFVNIEILSPDNNVGVGVTTPSNPPGGAGISIMPNTDRVTILSKDSTFTSVTVSTANIVVANPRVRVNFGTAAETAPFVVGGIYYLESYDSTGNARRTFAAVTAKNTGGNNLTFGAAADPYGLNPAGNNAPIQWVSNGGVLSVTISRILMVHYFVRSSTVNGVTSGLLTRRVIGDAAGGYTDAVIAEHVTNVQFRYQLNLRDANNQLLGPVDQFATAQQQSAPRQVEVSLTTESTHVVKKDPGPDGIPNTNDDVLVRQTATSDTSTSLRNFPGNNAL